jgi:hypothetical protein
MDGDGVYVSAKPERSNLEDRSANQLSIAVEPDIIPTLATGTRSDINIQSTKGLRIATKCETLDQFIASYHRLCEDSAIFIPRTRRAVGSITEFSFDLANGRSALVGVGSVVEEFTDSENRFKRVGVVIALQQLRADSRAVFQRLLAARSSADQEESSEPLISRTSTAPIPPPELPPAAAIIALPTPAPPAPAPAAMTSPSPQIPSAPSGHSHRAKTVMGIPTISKLPAGPAKLPAGPATLPGMVPASAAPQAAVNPPKPSVAVKRFEVPVIPAKKTEPLKPDAFARAAKPEAFPEATPRPELIAANGVPETIAEFGGDTIRDEVPFALRNFGNAQPVPIAHPPSVFEAETVEGRAAISDIDDSWGAAEVEIEPAEVAPIELAPVIVASVDVAPVVAPPVVVAPVVARPVVAAPVVAPPAVVTRFVAPPPVVVARYEVPDEPTPVPVLAIPNLVIGSITFQPSDSKHAVVKAPRRRSWSHVVALTLAAMLFGGAAAYSASADTEITGPFQPISSTQSDVSTFAFAIKTAEPTPAEPTITFETAPPLPQTDALSAADVAATSEVKPTSAVDTAPAVRTPAVETAPAGDTTAAAAHPQKVSTPKRPMHRTATANHAAPCDSLSCL